jgi:hypothetical protein
VPGTTPKTLSRRGKVTPEVYHRAAELLARGDLTQLEVARAVDLGHRTIQRLARDEDFAALVEREREHALNPTARSTLERLLRSTDRQVQLRAAAILMQKGDETDRAPEYTPPPGATILYDVEIPEPIIVQPENTSDVEPDVDG